MLYHTNHYYNDAVMDKHYTTQTIVRHAPRFPGLPCAQLVTNFVGLIRDIELRHIIQRGMIVAEVNT